MLQQNRNTIFLRFPLLTIFLFVLLAYLPVLLPFFHLKNDVITQNLPTRFFMGEALYSHRLPWWNPYINYGFPQYADMNNGFWNPVQWLIAYFFQYSVLGITLEEIFYILIGGWGIYFLCKQLRCDLRVSLLVSVSYVTGGFIIGHLQHFCWITGTGFFPYVVLFFLKSYELPSIKNFFAGSIFSFLFIASTHPGLIIGSLYFFIFLIIYLFQKHANKEQRWKLTETVLWFLFFALLFSPVVWMSDIEGIKQMTRGVKVSYEEALSMPSTLQSYLSLLFPLAVNKGSFFNTDVSMRNTSIGLIGLFGFICFFYRNKKNLIIILGLAFFVLLSAGILKALFYQLPLLGFVRLNGEFFYFVFLSGIVLSAKGLSAAMQSNWWQQLFSKYLNVLVIVFIFSMMLSLAVIFILKLKLNTSGFKLLIDSISFWHLLLINSLINVIFCFFYKNNPFNKIFLAISFIHLVVVTWLGLPFTGIGQMPRSKIQSVINTVPKGIIKPYQKPVNANSYIDSSYQSLFLEVAFYSKQIGYPRELQYPVELYSVSNFFGDSATQNFINQQSWLFLSADSSVVAKTNFDSNNVQINMYSPTYIKATIHNNGYHFITLLQNNYPGWKVLVDKKPVEHFTVYHSFIGVPIADGTHEVEYFFDASSLEKIAAVNLFILLLGIVTLCIKNIRSIVIV